MSRARVGVRELSGPCSCVRTEGCPPGPANDALRGSSPPNLRCLLGLRADSQPWVTLCVPPAHGRAPSQGQSCSRRPCRWGKEARHRGSARAGREDTELPPISTSRPAAPHRSAEAGAARGGGCCQHTCERRRNLKPGKRGVTPRRKSGLRVLPSGVRNGSVRVEYLRPRGVMGTGRRPCSRRGFSYGLRAGASPCQVQAPGKAPPPC